MVRTTTELPLSNAQVAQRLEEIAGLLEEQGANPFRVRAYRRAADTVRGLDEPLHARLDVEGTEGLLPLPGIGHSLARTIEQLVRSDHVGLLDRLRGGSGARDVFTTLPGIGPELARRIHEELGIETLLELDAAARDGSLSDVPGLGRRRLQAVADVLAARFGRVRGGPVHRQRTPRAEDPPVAELLDVDHEYLAASRTNELPRIAPKRFNPTQEAWLPILHTERGDRHYTALFSNTARAHELGTNRDWVVVYRDDHGGEGQWTVVTAQYGPLRGKRIVRGREPECAEHYASLDEGARAPSVS